MATANICDRCGKVIPNETSLFGFIKDKGYGVLFTPLAGLNGGTVKYDLCLDCSKEFKKWVKKE